jgi:hypothetical protein
MGRISCKTRHCWAASNYTVQDALFRIAGAVIQGNLAGNKPRYGIDFPQIDRAPDMSRPFSSDALFPEGPMDRNYGTTLNQWLANSQGILGTDRSLVFYRQLKIPAQMTNSWYNIGPVDGSGAYLVSDDLSEAAPFRRTWTDLQLVLPCPDSPGQADVH